ncbi:MAG: class I SAM-dependent methyltransferase [Candidatus Cloacimonetes bacterium]|nr:class I SAM-dependent methyltransferase [Candidatus Cloacimonadota bacterium]MCF7814871.1 class I SAM-dependent methyltransferase [Candidatus Cloacimonadota bacterium]MCF7867953.1 class I SAM-dependent methyltransferase [Candidatus Cloacimonadota bacterium]MCF7883411.1 class I SAM-dependent methyltransferase [Candidatus Cloacimonadota bacterium]
MKKIQYSDIYDWEFEMICTRQKHDIKLWKNLAAIYGGQILEICCGSGRITQELAAVEFQIIALDNSAEMLTILEKKKLDNVQIVLADMRNFQIDRKFKFAFISYSSFQQLLTQEDQFQCLNAIKRHLANDGVLGIDINPHILEGPETTENEIALIADYPPNNSRITMFSSYQIDRKNRIKHWKDKYVEIDKTGNKHEFTNEISLKGYNRKEMEKLFNLCGFEIVDVFGDFDGGKVTKESWNHIYLLKNFLLTKKDS